MVTDIFNKVLLKQFTKICTGVWLPKNVAFTVYATKMLLMK